MEDKDIIQINVDNDALDGSIPVDEYCVTHDIDDYDLFGEKQIEESNEDNDDIIFE